MTSVLQETDKEKTETEGRSHVKTEAEITVLLTETKNAGGHKMMENSRKDSPLVPAEAVRPPPHPLNFRLLDLEL